MEGTVEPRGIGHPAYPAGTQIRGAAEWAKCPLSCGLDMTIQLVGGDSLEGFRRTSFIIPMPEVPSVCDPSNGKLPKIEALAMAGDPMVQCWR